MCVTTKRELTRAVKIQGLHKYSDNESYWSENMTANITVVNKNVRQRRMHYLTIGSSSFCLQRNFCADSDDNSKDVPTKCRYNHNCKLSAKGVLTATQANHSERRDHHKNFCGRY